jgi:hypothetical protein
MVICPNDLVLIILDHGDRWVVIIPIIVVYNNNEMLVVIGIKIKATTTHNNSPAIAGTKLVIIDVPMCARGELLK